MIYDVAVVGGGAAGLMAAGRAKESLKSVCILEKNPRVGKKLLITGKGRCNVTNGADISDFFDNIVVNKKFLYSAFYSFTNKDVMNFFEKYNVPLKIERGKRVFPASDRSSDILGALKQYNKNTDIFTFEAENIEKNDGIFEITDKHGKCIKSKKVIIATGGLSYPETGSTGDGYRFAKKFGHTVTELSGALVPLISPDIYPKMLEGLSLKNVSVTLYDSNNKNIYNDFGEMLFTGKGVSGPVILSLSAYIKKGERYKISIDLKPALSPKKLEERIIADFNKYLNKDFKNCLADLCPKRLIPVMVERSSIDGNKKVNNITKEERARLVSLFKDFTLNISGKEDIREAIITAGGIKVSEINPKTMESKIVPGLFFAGEIIDVHGYTGGFNLQIAFSTGYLAGN